MGRFDTRRIFLREPLCFSGVGHRADNRKPYLICGQRLECDIGHVASDAIRVKQLVAANSLDGSGRARDEVIDGIRVALAPEPVRIRAEGNALRSAVDFDAPGMGQVVLTENEMAKHQEAARLALNLDRALQRGVITGRYDMHADGATCVTVLPAAIAEPHFEARWQREKFPRPIDFREHAKPAGAGNIVGIARDGKKLVKRRVADGELRCENAMHPACRAKNGIARQEVLTAADDGSVAPSHHAVFLAQHGVPVPLGHPPQSRKAIPHPAAPHGGDVGEYLRLR